MAKLTEQIGAGGLWSVIGERHDSSVEKQITSLSCVAAVGIMLLQNRGILMTHTKLLMYRRVFNNLNWRIAE